MTFHWNTVVRLQSKDAESVNLDLGINSQHPLLKVKLYSEHSHQFFWMLSALYYILTPSTCGEDNMPERSLAVSDFCTSQCTCLWGQGEIPSAPLFIVFIGEGTVVCAVFLNLISSYSLSYWKHSVIKNLGCFFTWFEDFSNLVLMVVIILKYLCLFYNILFIDWESILTPASAEELYRISATWDIRGKVWYSW